MVKIVWLLKKADHLTDEQFKNWWLESHVPIARAAPGLRKYVVNFGRPDSFAGKPTFDCEWELLVKIKTAPSLFIQSVESSLQPVALRIIPS